MCDNQQPLYTPAGFYLLHAPVFSVQTFLHALAETVTPTQTDSTDLDTHLATIRHATHKTLQTMLDDSLLEQALQIASPDLSSSLAYIRSDYHKTTSKRRIERIYHSLFNYVVRMSTHPTPSGLCAGVALGPLASQTTLQLVSPTIEKIHTRPHINWQTALIQKIEADQQLFHHLTVVINPTVYIADSRLILPYADIHGQGDQRCITLRANSVIRYILEKARKPIPYIFLHQELRLAFPQATQQQVDNLLWQLWEQHFLISDLRPPLTHPQPAQYILERLDHVNNTLKLRDALNDVINMLTAVDQIGVGGPIFLLQALADCQRYLQPSQAQPYHVDTTLHTQQSFLHHDVGTAVAEAAEVLLRLSRFPQGHPHLRTYYTAFVTRYGTDTEIPLVDLLSSEVGLDAPPTYTEPPRSYPLPSLPTQSPNNRDQLLSSLLTETLYAQRTELMLTDAHIAQLSTWQPDSNLLPPSTLELYLQLHSTSTSALDKGEWLGVLSPRAIAAGGTAFHDVTTILGDPALIQLQHYTKQAEALHPNHIYAELSYLPARTHNPNIAPRPTLYNYEIVVNTTPSVPHERVIPLNDLVVGVKNNHFYIRSLRFNKEVIVKQSTAVDPSSAPNLCRFLLEASNDGHPIPTSFDWGTVCTAPYLPRVRYKKIILSPAMWHLSLSQLEPTDTGLPATRFFSAIQHWRTHWQVPRYVYFTHNNNRFLLDLEHPLSVAELVSTLHKDPQLPLCLQEMLPDFHHLWLQDTAQQPYVAEFVIPLLRNQYATNISKQTVITQRQKTKIYPRYPIALHERRQLPGSDWISLKLYTPAKQHNEVIAGPLRSFVRNLNEQDLIGRWFFTRSNTPEPHLYLCFHAADPQVQEKLLHIALGWGREMVQHNFINNFLLDSYDRAIESYGGPHMIDSIENVFTVNSVATCDIITALYTRELTLDPIAVAVFTLDHFLEFWGLDFTQRLHFVQCRTEKYAAIKSFRPQRPFFCELLKRSYDISDPLLQVQRELLFDFCAVQASILLSTVQRLRELVQLGELWMPEAHIIQHLLHSHLNRLLNPDTTTEQHIYAFWRHTLEAIARKNHAEHRVL